MKTVTLDYGNRTIAVNLPDTVTTIEAGKTYQDPDPVFKDQKEATLHALKNPLNMKPLRELAGPGKKVVIGFPDRVKGGAQKDAHRRITIPLILKELMAGGCKMENISLMCCIGLHRMNTLEEFNWYLGKDIVDLFYPDRIFNHDAEKDIIDLGIDHMGNAIEINRHMANADLPIVIGHTAGNPYGGYSGGYKMIVTGISGARSIASHHCPDTMHREDWLGCTTKSHMRKQFHSIGKAMEAGIDNEIFAIDAVLGMNSQVLQVAAGSLEAVEKATWPLADQRTFVSLPKQEPADVLIMGVPRDFHYGPGMGSNPILMGLAIGGQVSRCWAALRPGCVVIAAAVCDGWFNPHWFPSYEETYQTMQNYDTPSNFLISDEAAAISQESDYLWQYSNKNTYHPFHAMSMISGGSMSLKWCSKVTIVGAKKPGYARGMGFATLPDLETALKDAERYVGKNPKILATPRCFSSGMAVHLTMDR